MAGDPRTRCCVLPPGVGAQSERDLSGIGETPIYRAFVTFWQLAIDANDPSRLARFWAAVLGYQPVPPIDSPTTWHAHYRRRLGNAAAFDDRIFDPAGGGPPIWFQKVPESKAGKNRLHLDVYPTGRDDTLTMARRIIG